LVRTEFLTLYTRQLAFKSRAIAQADSRRLFTLKIRLRFQVSPREICGRRTGTGPGFSPITVIFSCQYHSTSIPYSAPS